MRVDIPRFIFCLLYYGFAQFLPVTYLPGGKIAKALRYRICRHLFKTCGENVNVERKAFFHSGSSVSIGDNSAIGENARISGEVIIGRDVMMAPDVTIWSQNHNHSRTDIPMRLQGYAPERTVEIGDDVWIGSNVILLPGVKIGHGAVVGAGAVVVKDVPDFAVVAGNPATVLKVRK